MNPTLHVSLAIVVASGLYEQAAQCTTAAPGMKLLRMAADVIDHTLPDPAVLQAYHFKSPAMSDARFLAQNLALIAPLPVSRWPTRKVRSREWGEYTRIMQGLDEAMGAPAVTAKERVRNQTALEAFVRKHAAVLDQADQDRLLAHFAPQPPTPATPAL
jgi:hypothetical protein